MELFGENYLKIRNEYVIPLIDYGIKRDRYQYWLFKDVLTNKITSFSRISESTYEIELDKNDFYRGLYCDIELFINKSIIQYSDYVNASHLSKTWSFVTLYYLSFFTSTTLFRFLRKGFIFLNNEHLKRIEDFSLALYSEPITLKNGNYYFSFKEENSYGKIVITLTWKGNNVHKLNWYLLENTIKEFLPNCDDDERLIYSHLLTLFLNFSTEYPSNTRNRLNYSGESSFLDLNNMLPTIEFVSISNDYIKSLLLSSQENTDTNKVYGTAYISIFLYKLSMRLYEEFIDRSEYGQDFSKQRRDYIKTKKNLIWDRVCPDILS